MRRQALGRQCGYLDDRFFAADLPRLLLQMKQQRIESISQRGKIESSSHETHLVQANHESARTTGLYDRRNDQLTLDEVERTLI